MISPKITTCVILLACLLVQSANLFSQRITIWKGGTPGQETRWECPRNWSGNDVPDEFSNVIIPDVSTRSLAYPVLKDISEINSLLVEGNAVITITSEGQLTVFNDFFVVHEESLKIEGILKIINGLEQSDNVIATLWKQPSN